jgi:hypothetical protein
VLSISCTHVRWLQLHPDSSVSTVTSCEYTHLTDQRTEGSGTPESQRVVYHVIAMFQHVFSATLIFFGRCMKDSTVQLTNLIGT